MINDRITDKELEMFAAEPENNLAFVPNHAMAQKMAKELLSLRACRHNWNVIRLVEVGGRYQYCTLCGNKRVAE